MNMLAPTSITPTRISVLTATWNRAALLPKCFRSLCEQDPWPCEWIVVDDGSTDDTPKVLSQLSAAAPFPVRLLSQANSGKHRAVNRAVEAATGELALILDSDDTLTPKALGVIAREWSALPAEMKEAYAGLVGHSVDRNGTLIGSSFSADAEHMSSLRLFHSGQVQGDKLFVHRRDLLQRFPFPSFPGETFVSEGIVWDRIRQSFRYRLLNDALQVVEYQPDGLSAMSLRARVNNPVGARAYYQQLASLDIPWFHRLRSLVNYQRFASHGGVRSAQAFSESPWPAVSALLLPLGVLAARLDRARLKTQPRDMERA